MNVNMNIQIVLLLFVFELRTVCGNHFDSFTRIIDLKFTVFDASRTECVKWSQYIYIYIHVDVAEQFCLAVCNITRIHMFEDQILYISVSLI